MVSAQDRTGSNRKDTKMVIRRDNWRKFPGDNNKVGEIKERGFIYPALIV